MVTHPFVIEMGDGTLPREKFRTYFIQDYLFVSDLVNIVAHGIAKAPDFHAAGKLNQFLSGILDPENDLFQRAFAELDVDSGQIDDSVYLPITQAFGDFLVRTGLEGSFEDILAVLYVTEGTYLDWATRLIRTGARSGNHIYDEWIDIHGPDVLGELVRWMNEYLDINTSKYDYVRIDYLFSTALNYEYRFWEAVYRSDSYS